MDRFITECHIVVTVLSIGLAVVTSKHPESITIILKLLGVIS